MRQLSRSAQLRWFAEWFAGRPVKATTPDEFFSGALRFVRTKLAEWEPPDGPLDAEMVWEIWGEFSGQLVGVFGDEGKALEAELRALIDPERRFLSLAELAPELPPLSWVWEHWLPAGMLSLLAARPGTGKSLVALDLCRRVIAGEAWPDGSVQTRAGQPCIYVDAENVPAILNQRAEEWEQWGMDRRLIYPVIPDDDDGVVNLGGERYRELLEAMAFKLAPGLIVVDSLRDVLPAGESNVEDVRSTLAFLSNLATSNGCAVLLVHHLRKGSNSGQLALLDSIDLDQVSGSGYIGGRARVVLGLTKVQVGEEPDKNGPRKLEVVKTNLGEYPKDMGIVFERTPPDGLRLVWSANAPKRYQEEAEPEVTRTDEAQEWLVAYLEAAGEPVMPSQVQADAQTAGISQATLFRARAKLEGQVINTAGKKVRGNRWQLASANEAAESLEAAEV